MAVFEINYFAYTLNRRVPVNVILPTDKFYFPGMKKREEGKPYKTLYLLHGVTDNYTDWLYRSQIIQYAEEKDLAVVMPSGDNSFYVNHDWDTNLYGDFITKDLIEFTRKTFPLSLKREDTYIAGLSMGGYGAIRSGLMYPETFGAVASLSGAFWPNEEKFAEPVEKPFYFVEKTEYRTGCFGQDLHKAVQDEKYNLKLLLEKDIREKKELPDIYMACGTEDGLLPLNKEMSDFLTANNISHTFETGAGNHEWDFWNRYIRRVIEWLPTEDKEEKK